ncbi:MAG: hypothetical protein RIC87_08030 [Kiloniellales bacterium]
MAAYAASLLNLYEQAEKNSKLDNIESAYFELNYIGLVVLDLLKIERYQLAQELLLEGATLKYEFLGALRSYGNALGRFILARALAGEAVPLPLYKRATFGQVHFAREYIPMSAFVLASQGKQGEVSDLVEELWSGRFAESVRQASDLGALLRSDDAISQITSRSDVERTSKASDLAWIAVGSLILGETDLAYQSAQLANDLLSCESESDRASSRILDQYFSWLFVEAALNLVSRGCVKVRASELFQVLRREHPILEPIYVRREGPIGHLIHQEVELCLDAMRSSAPLPQHSLLGVSFCGALAR